MTASLLFPLAFQASPHLVEVRQEGSGWTVEIWAKVGGLLGAASAPRLSVAFGLASAQLLD